MEPLYFSLSYLIELLKNHLGVEIFVSKPLEVPVARKSRKKCSKQFFYNGDCSKVRKFLYVTFCYEGRHVLMIEIDSKGLKEGPSTYLLVSRKDFKKPLSFAKLFLMARQEMENVGELEKYFLEKHSIKVHFKKHPSKTTKKAMFAWCKSVEKLIVG